MKLDVPILWPTRHTPPRVRGLTVQSLGAQDASGAWIFGSLVLPEGSAGSCAEWLARVALVAVSERHGQPRLGYLLGTTAFHAAPAWSTVDAGGPARCICFAAHTRLIFGTAVALDTTFVHAVAGELVAAPIKLAVGAPRALEAGGTVGDLLVAAYDAAFRGEHGKAVAGFDAAFAAGGGQDDLDGAHRYNAACVSARAAAALRAAPNASVEQLARAGDFERRALEWLRTDLRQRAGEHQRRAFAWAVSRGPEGDLEAEDALYRDHVRQLHADPDLAGLRLSALVEG